MLSEWSFSRGQIFSYLARIQDIQLLNEKFQKSVMSALHGGDCTFACITEKLGSSYSITLSLEKEIIVLEKSLEKVWNFGSKNLYEPNPDSTYSEMWKNHQGPVPRKMVKFNPGIS